MSAETKPLRIAVAGNPNVGKTSLFNRLTGSRYKVGNYPGITVESREGTLLHARAGEREVHLIDLPGVYSTTPMSEDEAVTFRELAKPGLDGVLLVVDATNLARNLYLFLQIRELGLPIVVALNMVDLAREAGLPSEAATFADVLGCAVVSTDASRGEGIEALRGALSAPLAVSEGRHVAVDDEGFVRTIAPLERACGGDHARAGFLLCARAAENDELVNGLVTSAERIVMAELAAADAHAAAQALVIARYREVDRLLGRLPERATANVPTPAISRSARVDAVLTHRVFGPLVFLAVMALVFQSIFTWAAPVMDAIGAGMSRLSLELASVLGPGLLTDLLSDGVIAGVGNVIVFVPQIALLFLFIGLLEDSGYMARAAFIVDRVMAGVGLTGKSFVPLLSGYACAVPAILGARTIPRFRDRVLTILMIPFMSCSARLPIYALVIAALFEADRPLLGPFTQGGVILLSMYALSTVSALAIGAVYKRTILPGPTPALVLELPPYRLPRIGPTLRHVADRTVDFLRDAGTMILAVTIVLWALLNLPQVDEADLAPGETTIERSIAGRIGHAMEPALEPIGQDWRVGIGLLGSFAAREVLVSTLGLVYGIEGADDNPKPLARAIREAENPDGTPRHTPLSGVALMVFFVYACQCMSTLAVVRRETRSIKWPLFMFFSMTALAWVAAFFVYQGGRLLGF